MTRNKLVAMFVFFLAAFPIMAQTSGPGTRAFPFLNLDFDGRSMAMGGASIALPNDLYGNYTNPAASGFIEKKQGLLGVRSVIQDVFGGPIGYAMPYSTYGTFAINLASVSYGSIDQVIEGPDTRPLNTGVVWRSYSVVGGISWSKIIYETLAFGAAIRGIHDYIGSSSEYYSADAVSFQTGLQYRLLDSRLIFGLALSNIGAMVSSYSEQTEDLKLPLSVSVGFSYVPSHIPTLRVAMDLVQAADSYLMYKPGLELAVYKKYLFLRAGYRFSETDLEEVFKGFRGESIEGYERATWYGPSFGFGINTNINNYAFNIDAAVQFNKIEPAVGLSILLTR